MRHAEAFRTVFIICALYDVVLGLAFFFFYVPLNEWLSVPLPENPVYLQAAAMFIAVQGVGYYFVFKNLERNVDLIKVGVLFKATYALLALYYTIIGVLPHGIYGLFGVIDVGFLVLFVLCLRAMSHSDDDYAQT